jgi:hypothetical protein
MWEGGIASTTQLNTLQSACRAKSFGLGVSSFRSAGVCDIVLGISLFGNVFVPSELRTKMPSVEVLLKQLFSDKKPF